MLRRAHKNRRTPDAADGVLAETFLRSINIQYDAEEPSRIAHFHPTSKSVALIRSLLAVEQERAFFVVAPYGSGKSLTAAYLLHLIENRKDSVVALVEIEQRLRQVSPELARFAKQRRSAGKNTRGLVLALHGHCPSLGKSLKAAALDSMKRLGLGRRAPAIRRLAAGTIEDAVTLLTVLRQKVLEAGCDRILIVWDEFGRHLESLVADGRPAALNDVQTLAEFISRSEDLPMALGLFLHQDLVHYAGNVTQSVRREWAKIEGRFQTLQYLDDSKELYRLIGEVMAARGPTAKPSGRNLGPQASACKRLGLFADFTKQELADLLEQAYPLEPTSLYLLPRVSARVAQNERTLFSFLFSANLEGRATPDGLYDYFSAAMRSDTAVGGTHRQWLETESALSKVAGDEAATRALKTTCLLGLGKSGERSRAGRKLLLFALKGYGNGKRRPEVIDELIDCKLLLHRRHSDEVSVWHGTDADLRGRLEEEKRQHRAGFDLIEFLEREVPPPAWRPTEYNDEFAIRRYFPGEYRSMTALEAELALPAALEELPSSGCDGQILYLVVESDDERAAAEEIVRQGLKHDRTVLAIPRAGLALSDAALEVWSLQRMQLDADLLESDPLVGPELGQMLDDAGAHLQRLLDNLVRPSARGPRWFYQGKELWVENARDLREGLSEICRTIYGLTPKINNEMIVRRRPSAVIVNARKKLVLGILERSGQKGLGIQGNFPDASMFRTVLLHTGLYHRRDDGRWGWASPTAIKDPGLRAVWQAVRDFLTTPSEVPKGIGCFIESLQDPPYGVRAGLIPIFFAAGLKAFPSAVSLSREGEYVTDILPSVVEEMCKDPGLFELQVLDLDEAKEAYLRDFHRLFTQVATYEVPEVDLIRKCFDALQAWKAQLPPSALTTKRLSFAAQRLQALLRQETDPVRALLEKIPALCGHSIEDRQDLLEVLRDIREELAGVASLYYERAGSAVRRALAVGHMTSEQGLRAVASNWSYCFTDVFVESLADGVAKGLLSRMRMPYDSDELLLDSLASLLVGDPLSRWDDSTVTAFGREIQDVVRRIEEVALRTETGLSEHNVAAEGLAELVRVRIGELYGRLVDLVGPEQARVVMESTTRLTQGSQHGND